MTTLDDFIMVLSIQSYGRNPLALAISAWQSMGVQLGFFASNVKENSSLRSVSVSNIEQRRTRHRVMVSQDT